MDPFQTVLWMLSQLNVRDVALDINGDGDTLLKEKILMLSHKDAVDNCYKNSRCNSHDRTNLLELQTDLHLVLIGASTTDPSMKSKYFNIYRLPIQGEFEADRRFSEEDANLARSTPTRSEFLNGNAIVECIAQDNNKQDLRQSGVDKNTGTDKRLSLNDISDMDWLGKVLLRGSVEDLTKSGKRASSASINVKSDRIGKKTTYDIDAILGVSLNFSKKKTQDYVWDNLLFLGLNRFKVTNGGSDINEVSFGLMSEVQFRTGDVNHIIKAWPAYITDLKSDVSLGTLELAWAPIFGEAKLNPLISPIRIDPVWFSLDLEGRLQAGKVFDDGGQVELQDTQEYLRAGWHARTQFFGVRGSLIEHFKWGTHYTNTTGFAGQFDNVDFFKSELSYAFDSEDTVSLKLSYENGHKGNQLTKVNLWKIGFGVKY